MRKTLGCIRKADTDFNMINEGEHICVALSGGKDSMLLLKALKNYTYFSKNRFTLTAISIDVGFENTDYTKMERFCRDIDVPLEVERTNIKEVVFDERMESNPCSLCSKMKKGALNDLAIKLGSNKVAYGHHRDDFIESFFLSLFYEGRFHTFKPVTFLDRKKVTSIRPLIYLKEKEVISAIKKENIPIIKSECPVDGYTKREDIKKFLTNLKKDIHMVDDRIFKAILNQMDNWE